MVKERTNNGSSLSGINRRDFIRTGTAAFAGFATGIQRVSQPPQSGNPNFIFILIDDLGWADTGCYGSSFYETPRINRLANEGMRFTNAYAASPVCSPTRASILTGKHPARLHITDWIGSNNKGRLLPPKNRDHLPLEEITIAEALKKKGYATGFIGKWHLGKTPYYPEHQGFDLNIAGHHAGQPASYFYPYKGKGGYWDVPDLEDGKAGEYLTDRLTDESLRFIERNRNRPFLLFLSHYAVHTPIQSKREQEEKYKVKAAQCENRKEPAFTPEGKSLTRRNQDHPAYAGMIESVDESVGRILDKVAELGLSDNTVVIFFSDNGGLSTLIKPYGKRSPTSNDPLRAGKGWLYEGGIREPLIIRWPGRVQAGTVCNAPVLSTDFYPTMLEMAGLPLNPRQHKDGLSLIPLLRGKKPEPRALFWHYPHYHGSGSAPSSAIRIGDYKLIEWYEDGRRELYNLAADLSEHNNLLGSHPEKAKELSEQLHHWLKQVSAGMPRPNPDWKD